MTFLIRTNQREEFLKLGGTILSDEGEYYIGEHNTKSPALRLKLAFKFTVRP